MKKIHPAVLVVLLAACGGSSGTDPDPAPQPVTLAPTAIPLSAPEVVNPSRGYFRWYGLEMVPQPALVREHYARFGWRSLEPTRGVYDFAAIDQRVQAARAAGARFGFRIMALNEHGLPMEVPDYLATEAGGSYCTVDGRNVWVPDWDSPAFIARVRALVQALAARYDGSPDVSYYELGIYGRWGEWHTFDLCTPAATVATRKALVDAQMDPFTRTRMVMNSGGSETEVFLHAMNRSPRVGVRIDSWCDPWFHEQLVRNPAKQALMQERWKTAPIIAEPWGPGHFDADRCLDQVRTWHVAMLANGNLEPWGGLTQPQRDRMIEAGKASGYRFVLDSVTYAPDAVGRSASIRARWSNAGITPAYDAWAVTWELRAAGSATPVATAVSALDLERLLPGTASQVDRLELPAGLSPGSYTLSVAVLDPAGHRAPLALAITGRDAAGRYPLGSITVR